MGTEDRLRPYISELADKLATEWLDRSPDYSAWKHPTEAVATEQMEKDALERLKQMNTAPGTCDTPHPDGGEYVATSDFVNPQHYKQHKSGVECIDIIEHADSPNLANVIKYVWRVLWGNKGQDADDLRKARWYIDREIKRRGIE